ncbi:MAG: hypothetical protein ACXVPN_16480 [Bacteroidia bacterium]
MEKTNMNKTNEVFDETSRMTSKWLSDSCSVMANFYEKQLKNVWDTYSTFFDSAQGEKNGYAHAGYLSPFVFGNNLYRSMMGPFNLMKPDHNYAGFINNYFEDLNKQARDFKNRIFSVWAEEFKNNYANWDEFNKLMEEEWKVTQRRVNSMHDSYMKHLNSSIELNKKLADEMSNAFETAVAMNKKMWDDLTKKPETSDKTEKETERKEWHPKKHSRELAHH